MRFPGVVLMGPERDFEPDALNISSGARKWSWFKPKITKCDFTDIRHYPFKPWATGCAASGGNPWSKMRSENMKMCVLSVFHVFWASGTSYSDPPRRVNMEEPILRPPSFSWTQLEQISFSELRFQSFVFIYLPSLPHMGIWDHVIEEAQPTAAP